ncbi:MAG: hypothetical protein SFT68_05875 [Rickettsiaceae bacterium]|nr:hypothetical protein [Rickettsiaceae bacterium]
MKKLFSKHIYAIFNGLLIIFIACQAMATNLIELQEIYIEDQGNNKYEAQIKALDKGYARAIILLTTKLDLDGDSNIDYVKKIPVQELRALFQEHSVENEVAEEYSSGGSYSGTLSVACAAKDLYVLLDKYTNKNLKYKFTSTLVIPVLKINKILYYEKDSIGWISAWRKAQQTLKDNNIILLTNADFDTLAISKDVITSADFNYYMSHITNQIFDKVVIAYGEFFTNKDNGDSTFLTKYTTITQNNKTAKQEAYNINAKNNKFQDAASLIIKKFIEENGVPINTTDKLDRAVKAELKKQTQKIKDEDESKQNAPLLSSYVLLIQNATEQELAKIQEKLNNIKDIARFDITASLDKSLKLKISTKLNLYELTKQLYDNQLSYFYDDNKHMILMYTGS